MIRSMIRCCWLAALAVPCLAFDGHRVEEGPLRLTIEAFESPRAAEVPVEVPVVLENHGPQPVECALRVHGLVDEWHAAGPAEATLAVAPGGAARHAFRIAAAEQPFYNLNMTNPEGAKAVHELLRASRQAMTAEKFDIAEGYIDQALRAMGVDPTTIK